MRTHLESLFKPVNAVSTALKNKPYFDPDFTPLWAVKRAYENGASLPVYLALESDDALTGMELRLRGTEQEDCRFAERMAKLLLWQAGGSRLYVCGPEAIYRQIADAYSPSGARRFDASFMRTVYQTPFEVVHRAYDNRPAVRETPQNIGRHRSGCRIGLSVGSGERFVAAVIDGEPVFLEETVWYPERYADPEYHISGVLSSLQSAAEHLPRVDAIGISSAGIYRSNQTAAASLFRRVSEADFARSIRALYPHAAEALGSPPLAVCNDGDVTALAGAVRYGRNTLLALSLGSGVAAGYVDREGRITGKLSELASAPVDWRTDAPQDEWSGDVGCAASYFSQRAVLRLAKAAGLPLPHSAPADQLKAVQIAAAALDSRALCVFSDIGCYLGHTLPLYHMLYGMKTVLLTGRVMAGAGGETVLLTAKRVLATEYPHLNLDLILPDDPFRRTGQAVAAASLAAVR